MGLGWAAPEASPIFEAEPGLASPSLRVTSRFMHVSRSAPGIKPDNTLIKRKDPRASMLEFSESYPFISLKYEAIL